MKHLRILPLSALIAMLLPVQAWALITSQPSTKLTETDLFQYSLGAVSNNHHAISFTLMKGPKAMRLDDNVLIWQTNYDDAGEHEVIVEANDGVTTEQQRFTLHVANKNRAPVFTTNPVLNLQEGQAFDYTVAVSDADGDKVSIQYLELPKTVKRDGQHLFWQTNYQSAGIYPFHIRISDGKASAEQEFVLNVADVNRAPTFATIAPEQLKLKENQSWQLAIQTADADGDKVQLSLNSSVEGLKLEGNQLSWKPSYQQAGAYPVTILASDGKDSSSLTLNLEVENVNRLPNFIMEPETQLQETELFQYNARAYDPDETVLQYQLLKAPKGMQIDSSHVVTWQTGYDDAGAHEVSIEVSDGEAKIQKNFVITVSNKNRQPEIQSKPVDHIKEGDLFDYTFQAFDADGDVLKIQYIQVPKQVTQKDNHFSWQTDSKSAGSYPFHIRVSDGQSQVDQTFNLVVDNVNHKPVFTSKPPTKAIEAVHYQYDFSAQDADKETLSYSLSQAPKGMQINGQRIDWTPSFEQSGVHSVVLVVSDGIDSVEQSFSINVSNTNREPTILDIADQTVYAGDKYRYQVNASDADGDAVRLSLNHAPGKMDISRSGMIEWKPKDKDIGEYTIIVKASDGDLETISHFNLQVVAKPAENQ